jgi:hypothetical protein
LLVSVAQGAALPYSFLIESMTLGISRVTPVEKIREWQEELTAWRRDFHTHPELGFEEERTSARVAERLAYWGI